MRGDDKMEMFIAKGVPYNNNESKIFKIWNNGKIIPVTQNQKIIWSFFYGKPKTYKDLMKYINTLFQKGYSISKTVLKQIITQLESLNLISSQKSNDSNLCEFLLVFKNKIIPIKCVEYKSNFEKKVYDFMEKYDIIALSDFIADMDDFHYDKLTNGYDEEYLMQLYNCNHSKAVLEIVKDFLKKGECCIG